MCIVAAKYFQHIGWVGVKNRDRNYIPELSFLVEDKQQPHRLLMHDNMTGYTEGMNNKGICVLSASLQVMDDEKEITKRTSDDNPDGKRIEESLLETSVKNTVKKLVELNTTGNTIVFDQETCYLIEACNKDEKYHFQVKEIKHTETVARTNHGILMPWAGYQKGIDENQTKSRESSESRLKQAEQALKKAKTPQELIDLLTETPNKDSQMNMLRTTTGNKKMRTTCQEMMIPNEMTFFLRPVQSKLDIDFWKINSNKNDLWVEILSNRILNHPKLKIDDPYKKYYEDYKEAL